MTLGIWVCTSLPLILHLSWLNGTASHLGFPSLQRESEVAYLEGSRFYLGLDTDRTCTAVCPK